MSAAEHLREAIDVGCTRDDHDHVADHRAEVLAEAKTEVVAWLVKKAAEKATWDAAVLASKVDRGAVRVFLGTGHYRDALDEHRAAVLAEAASAVETMWLPAATRLRRMATAGKDASESGQPVQDFFQPNRTYQRRRWLFQCLAVAPNPFNGESRAVGFLYRPGEPATATALDPDDWAHGGWTEGEAGRD